MKLVRRQMFSHPKSGTVIRGSNTFSPVVKLASYIIVATTIYRFLLDLLKEFLSIVIDLWCLIYDTCYQKVLISVQRHKELVEQVLTFKDFQYQPNRKFHRGG